MKTVTVKTLRISVKVVGAQLALYSDMSVRFFFVLSQKVQRSHICRVMKMLSPSGKLCTDIRHHVFVGGGAIGCRFVQCCVHGGRDQ